jgi:hypothetical protein
MQYTISILFLSAFLVSLLSLHLAFFVPFFPIFLSLFIYSFPVFFHTIFGSRWIVRQRQTTLHRSACCFSYTVSVGVVDKLALYCGGVRDPIDGDPQVAQFLLCGLELLTTLAARWVDERVKRYAFLRPAIGMYYIFV